MYIYFHFFFLVLPISNFTTSHMVLFWSLDFLILLPLASLMTVDKILQYIL
jgi:hypothetical protein